MTFCDYFNCDVKCISNCDENKDCVSQCNMLLKMKLVRVKHYISYISKDGVLRFCEKHYYAAGYLYECIKILEHGYTNETLFYLSYPYIEIVIRLRILFQNKFAYKKTTKQSSGHLYRIKNLRKISKSLKNLNRNINAHPVGDEVHQEYVENILKMGYVNIMNNVLHMVNIQDDIKINNEIKTISSTSQWNNKLKIKTN